MTTDNMVSVVVPVFNSQDKLIPCLESILNQDYRNLQIILVNDGSTDNSLTICREHADKDFRIQVIDQTNQGPAGARNAALEEAQGCYVLFVDSDDLLLPGAITSLVSAIHGVDGVIAKFVIESAGTISERGLIEKESILKREELLHAMIKKTRQLLFRRPLEQNLSKRNIGEVWAAL